MVTVEIGKDGDGTYQVRNKLGHQTVGLNSPGGDKGLTPMELICASLGLCVAITINTIVERDQLVMHDLRIGVEAFKAEDRPSRIERFQMNIHLEGDFDEKVKNKIIVSAKRGCTIGNTIQHSAEIDVHVK